MRVFIGGEEKIFPARWFFCPAGAKHWPGAHGAEASPWLGNYEVNRNWGEVTPWPKDPSSVKARQLDRGRNRGYSGKVTIGDPQWFIDGMLPADILDGPPPPMCPACQKEATATGGLVMGGTASARFVPPPLHCSFCDPAPTPGVWYVQASGFLPPYDIFNGVFRVPHFLIEACNWTFSIGGASVNVVADPLGIIVTFVGVGPIAMYRTFGGAKCGDIQDVPAFQTPPGLCPDFVTIYPNNPPP